MIVVNPSGRKKAVVKIDLLDELESSLMESGDTNLEK